ncbi:MAG: hypothetical protein DRQ55_08630 [Planctomycetota bacterium]|nr:MAG: hypothetical protein DRQ55_08630 [Planctomycetota bacterium]
MSQPPSDAPTDPTPAPDEPQFSVLREVARRIGQPSKITLPDEGSEHGASPLIDARAKPAGLAPRDRGNYQVLGEIARGGMGVILKSHDTDLGRDVAMKVLLPEHAKSDAILQRFVEEAQIGGQLQHPGIVPVYEMGLMADERPYFTMKLVKGRTLAKLLAERQSGEADRRRFLGIFEKVCETLAYAHARNVLHRDLKPANIMVGAFGEVQVVDWGLAKVLTEGGTSDEKLAQLQHTEVSIIETVRSGGSSGGSESMVGSIMGTPAYMPPEQALGEIDLLDERADVFALGAILCEILTGRPPYTGDRDTIIKSAARARLDQAKQRLAASGADDEIIQLCLECMAPARAARPRSAEPVLERVRAWLESQEQRMQRAQLRAAEAAIKARAEAAARRLTLALAATVLAVGLGGAGFWMHLERQAADARLELVAQVDGHIQQAGAFRGSGDFAAANAACDAAAAVVAAGGAAADLAERVQLARGQVDTARAAQARRNADEAARLALLAQLEEAILDEGLDVLMTSSQRNRLQLFEAAFAAYDVDPTAVDRDAALARLTALDAPLLLGQALDEFARVQRFFGWNSAEARRLTALARALDPDPLRNAVRDAIEGEDRAALSAFIVSDAASSWPPNSVAMLQVAIRSLNMGLDTTPMLRACQLNHPANPIINQLLAGRLQFASDAPPVADLTEALRFLSAALAARPDNAIVAARMSWILAELGRTDAAVAALVATRRRSPEVMWIPGIGAENLLGRIDPAERPRARLALFRGFAAALPESLRDQNNWAWALVTWPSATPEQLAEALQTLEQVVESDPDDDASRNSLGLAYVRAERWADAVPQLQRSMEIAGAPHVADMLGVAIALWQLDKRLLANEWIYQARAQRDPNDGDTERELALFWELADELMPAR